MKESVKLIAVLLVGAALAFVGFSLKSRPGDPSQDAGAPESLQLQLTDTVRRVDELEQKLDQAKKEAEDNKSGLGDTQAKLAEVQRNLADDKTSITGLQAALSKNSSELEARLAAPAPAPAPIAAPSAAPAAFSTDKLMRFLAIIKGDHSMGSGFIAKFKTGTSLITNAHVLSGNTTFTAQLADGSTIDLEGLRCAQGRDIVSVDNSKLTDGFEVMDDVSSGTAIGDDVVILGNSMGGGVITQIPGKITGIGPDLVEVDAKFVPGNSGSPVIHVKTGKVIGIATYAVLQKIDGDIGKDSAFANTERRFAYRIDNIPGWQTTAWPTFEQEGQIVLGVRDRTNALLDLAKDLNKTGEVHYAMFMDSSNPLHSIVEDFKDDMERYTPNDTHYNTSKEQFMSNVTDFCTQDIDQIHPDQFSPYHAKTLADQIEERQAMAKFFKDYRSW